jgi:hypothetical protein
MLDVSGHIWISRRVRLNGNIPAKLLDRKILAVPGVRIHAEWFAAIRLSMTRIMERRMKAAALRA